MRRGAEKREARASRGAHLVDADPFALGAVAAHVLRAGIAEAEEEGGLDHQRVVVVSQKICVELQAVGARVFKMIAAL